MTWSGLYWNNNCLVGQRRKKILAEKKLFFIGGHSLIGKTAILHIVISGSSPDVSICIIIYKPQLKKKARDSSIGRAKLWRCLGYKFKSYFEQFYFKYNKERIMNDIIQVYIYTDYPFLLVK